jgi:hypothetical protein
MSLGRCHPCAGEESELHVLLKHSDTQRWGEELLKTERQLIKEERAITKLLTVKKCH